MGLFDRIVRNVTREATRTLTNAVSDTVSNAVNNTIRDVVDDKVAPVVNRQAEKLSQAADAVKEHGKHAFFEVKLKEILENAGDYELKNNIALTELEYMCGREVYTRRSSRCYREPSTISYGIYKDGQCKLLIRLWKDYNTYNRVANREVWDVCKQSNVPMLDFFEYMPNESSYVKNRIEKYL